MTRHTNLTRPVDAETKAARRLQAAEGYLQLGLPDYALDELSRVEADGPFEAVRQGLTGEALKAAHRFDEAIPYFRQALDLIPVSLTSPVWKSLSECYAAAGDKAAEEECLATAAKVAGTSAKVEKKLTKLIERMLKKYGPRLAALAKEHNLPKLSVVLSFNNPDASGSANAEPGPDAEPHEDDPSTGSD
jgi:tetratricopeptide (TPR) repeat protein